MTNQHFTENKIRVIILTLLCVMPIIGMSIDLVAPSLPAIASNLNISTNLSKNIISIFLLAYGLGNFYTGFLTDAIGRIQLLRINLIAFFLVSLIPVFLPKINFLLLARFLQGFTIGGAAVLVRTITSDILPAERLVRVGPIFGAMWGLGPVIGPILGGYLQFYFGWQAGFIFFSIASFLILIAVYTVVPETHFNRHPLQLTIIKNNLAEVLSHRIFMAIVVLMGLTYSLIIVFNTMAPFLIQNQLHYSSIYFGHVAQFLGIIFLIATFILHALLKRFKTKSIYSFILITSSIIISTLLCFAVIIKNSVFIIVFASATIYFTNGIIFPMSSGKNLSLFKNIAGTATATMYLVNILITSLSAFLVSFIHVENIISLLAVYLLLSLSCVLIYFTSVHKQD